MVYCARDGIDTEAEVGVGFGVVGSGMEVDVAIDPVEPTGAKAGGWVEQAAERDKIQKQTADSNNRRWPFTGSIVSEKNLVEKGQR
jgi:hypothetical protein